MRKCVVTGVAGFIGSNLAEHLLALGDEVVGIDNFSTGKEKSIER
ncbi:MAG: NAD-dependent epimerase/dehydratase family protein, partial [Synergistaceae bacterium]|nr:NAD-dependent epimerase/dehydratase family protein [Synergistaceae bacterium]